MSENIRKEDQIAYACDYYRSFVQSAMEPILFDKIEGIDWQVLIGTHIETQLSEIYLLNEEDAIQYIFERKPNQRVSDLIRNRNDSPHERRLGFERRGGERRQIKKDSDG